MGTHKFETTKAPVPAVELIFLRNDPRPPTGLRSTATLGFVVQPLRGKYLAMTHSLRRKRNYKQVPHSRNSASSCRKRRRTRSLAM